MLGRILIVLPLMALGGYLVNRSQKRPVGLVRATLALATMNGVLWALWLLGWNSLPEQFGLFNVFATANAAVLAFLLGLKLALKSPLRSTNQTEN